MARCRSCGANIEWATSYSTGKPIPLDVGEVAGGNLAVINGTARPYSDDDARLHRERRRSHFASCPDAEAWRSK